MIFAFLLVVTVIVASVWRYGYGQALAQLYRRGQADISLALEGLASELQRYRDQAVLLARHPGLTGLDQGNTPSPEADRILLETADRTGAAAFHYVDTEGRVLARSSAMTPSGLSRSEYFARAMQGALGSAHAYDSEFGERVFYYAAPSFGPDGKVRGAVVAVVDVESIEVGWRGDGTALLVLDDGMQIFLSNRSELLNWRYDSEAEILQSPGGALMEISSRRFGRYDLWDIDLGRYLPKTSLSVVRGMPRINLTGMALLDAAPARQVAGLQAAVVAGLFLFFGGLLLLAHLRRSTLARVNAELEDRVGARTVALTRANAALKRENQERQEAEAALKKAQADLVQAGKLSALGQMSAGISHELNQPLMAIEQYAANGAAFIDRGDREKARANLGMIGEMARRMSRIIRNLRAFARNEHEPMGQVDIVAVTRSAIDLTATRLKRDGITLDWQPPAGPVKVRAGEVRLGQVIVNLITNAADAMAERKEKRLTIRIEAAASVFLHVSDTGPGIREPERIFDPFYSTKLVGQGEGMGLGLSISYGLVQSFGGNIRGANTASGARFTVRLERWQPREGKAA